jgi:hypothetical protein
MVKVEGKIIATFGDWVVTEYGIECTYIYYFIAKERLHESDWIYHVCEKTWVNKVDFENAFNHALDVHNVISPQNDHY